MARLLLLMLFATTSCLAQIQFTATANRTSAPVGEVIEITVAVDGAATGVPSPQLGQLVNLELVGGPSTSTQTSIVNGRVSSQKSYTYYFKGRTEGPASFGEMKIAVKGAVYTSRPIQLTILPAGQRAKGGDKEDVFIEIIPDKRKAFVGEQIVLTYKLYFSTTIYAPEFKEMPKSTGFWTEEFEMPSQLVPRDEVVGGQSYKSVIIRKVALFATTAGELTVEPLTAVVQVERRTNPRGRANDPFNDPFFNFGRRREQVEVTCRPLKLNIDPLPDAGRPQGEVAVGNYSIAAKLDKPQAATSDAVTLTVVTRGAGNIKMLPQPKISIPPDFEVFDPKVTDQVKRGPDKITGSKSLEFVLIPRAAGEQVIPAIELTYFDPASGDYKTASTQPLSLSVSKGAGGRDASLPYASKREVQSVGQDISYVKNSLGELVPLGRLPHQSFSFWTGLATPWLGLAGVMFILRRQEQAGRTQSGRRRKVLRDVRAHLADAEKASQQDKPESVTRTLELVVRLIATEWTGVSSPTATAEEWQEAWKDKGLPDDTWTLLVNALTLSERSRFAGGALTKSELNEAIAQLQSAVRSLEGGAA